MAHNAHKQKSHASLHRLMFILQQLSDELLNREAGVGLSQVRIMSALNTSVPRSQRLVAKELHQTEANISRQIRIMSKNGLVNISKNPKDARQRDVTLTAKGAATYEKAERLLNEHYLDLLKALTSEETQVFQSAIHKIVNTIHSS